MSDHNKPPIKKMASLSTQILDYYHKFGQNRDLERYLSFRQNYNKSSSEGSINTPCASASRLPSRESKSLDQLNFAKGTSSEEECQSEEEHVQVIRKEVSPQKDVDFDTARPMVQPEIKVKAKSTVDKPKKSYTFNCESNIAISLPFTQATSLPELVPRPETSTEYSQTDFYEQKLNQSIGLEDECVGQDKSPDNNYKASKRLEWDSLGDVGYEKDNALNKKQSRSMNTLEKSVLKDFFAEQGIEIKFTADGKKVQDKLSKIQEGKQSSSQGAIPKTPRERWRETLESIKQKYTNQSSSFNNSKKNLSKFRKIPSEQHSTPKVEIFEKFCQTSFIKMQTKEIQVDLSNGGSIRSAPDAGSLTSPSSFEYFSHISDNQETSDKENISPRNLNTQRDRKLRQSAKKLLGTQHLPQKNGTNDLELGVKLLCSLIESKSLNDKQKKSLARKIVTKITKGSLPLSEKSTSNSSAVSRGSLISSAKQPTVVENVSGVVTFSSSSSRADSLRSKPTSEDSKNIETSRKVIESSVEISSTNSNSVKGKGDNLNTLGKNLEDVSTSKSSSAPSVHRIEKCIEKSDNYKEKVSKVDDEKNSTMREWLDPLTKSEIEYNRKKGEPNKIVKCKRTVSRANVNSADNSSRDRQPSRLMQFVKEEKKSHLKWIENEIERLENLKHLLLTNDESDKDKTLSKSDDIAIYPAKIENDYSNDKIYSQLPTSRSDEQEQIYEEAIRVESEVEVVNPSQNYKRTIKKITAEASNNAEAKEGKPVKTTTFSIEEEKRFAKKDYVCTETEKSRKEERSKLETPQSCASESIRSYAKQRKEEFLESYRKTPVRLYDQPAESDHYSEPKETSVKQRFPTSNAYTSVSSSDFFISSDSVSIPISTSSSTTTTTHQYDNRIAVGVQTTDSILRTKPIYSSKLSCGCEKQCGCTRKVIHPTIREYRPKPNKQVQAHPPSIAYVITFDNSKRSEDSHGSAESLTLQEHLEKRRPSFQQRASEREKIIRKLHKLRYEREDKIREIVENTSITSIPRKLRDLPPPPTKYTRVFPTREMKAMTRRKYSKLSEVVEKVERERKERRKRSNKVLADMFNRRLQRHVHRGKLTLEHSRTVI